MISHLRGTIVHTESDAIILDVAGVGYRVMLPPGTVSTVQEATGEINLFCYTYVRENILRLYGFRTAKELELFELVNGVSGVGPLAALHISALGSVDKLKQEMSKRSDSFLTEMPGIGKKKAQKIILELTGKLRDIRPKRPASKAKKELAVGSEEAVAALANLGFSQQQAREAVRTAEMHTQNMTTEETVAAALKLLGK